MKNTFILLLLVALFPLSASAQYFDDGQPGFLIKPYLQYTTQTETTILWETNQFSSSSVLYGKSRFNSGEAILDQSVEDKTFKRVHELTLKPLEAETNYFYKVVSITEAGDTIQTKILPFKMAVKKDTPYAFTVFSDSQSNPEVWGNITNQALRERPNFALHAGDLVGLGYRKREWVYDFFAPSNNFMKQIPMFTILGNHEHDSPLYYQYFKNPEPEHYYSFKYGNAEFFMVDTNQYQEPGTPMYAWLEHALAASDATWKFVVHHHPPYSSEENDYGDTNYESSEMGDEEARYLVPLYEKYGVDIVFYGHIHMYERTWPVLENKVVENGGVHYINVGGSGGSLEQASPTRTWFSNKVRTVHHFAYVAINGENLQFQAIDEDGNLFDYFYLTSAREKKMASDLPPVTPVPEQSRRVFRDEIEINLQTVNSTDQIYYTTDGSAPSEHSKKAVGSILLDETTTLKAIAFNEHGKSPVSSSTFTKMDPLKSQESKRGIEKGISYIYYTGELEDEKKPIKNQLNAESSGVIDVLDPDEITHKEKKWGAVFSGFIEIPETGYYRFNGHAYHLFRFYLHNELLIEEYKREIDETAEIYLEKGLHPFKIEYYTHRKYKYMKFEYTGPDGIKKPVTDLNFYHK